MELEVIEVRLEYASLDKREWYQVVNSELVRLNDMAEAKEKIKI
jgi:hypothetical protein